MSWLLDTNIISELARPRPEPAMLEWADQARHFAVSAITVEELAFGLAWRPHPRVAEWLDSFLAVCTVHAVSGSVARRAGQVRGVLARRGQVRTQADMLIAATAWEHNLTLVTRNVRDFEDCGIALLNPFSA